MARMRWYGDTHPSETVVRWYSLGLSVTGVLSGIEVNMVVTHREIDLRVGDRVFDRQDIDDPDEVPSLGIVTAITDNACGDVVIERDGEEMLLHEYPGNEEYAGADDPVVTVVFADWMDKNIPAWNDHADDPDALVEHLDEMTRLWGIPVANNSYDFPVPRLSLRHRPTET